MVLVVKNPAARAGDTGGLHPIPGSGRPSGGGTATHSSALAWRIPWTEEPGGLPSMGLQRVRHNRVLCIRGLSQHSLFAIFEGMDERVIRAERSGLVGPTGKPVIPLGGRTDPASKTRGVHWTQRLSSEEILHCMRPGTGRQQGSCRGVERRLWEQGYMESRHWDAVHGQGLIWRAGMPGQDSGH